jgi:hypothetical protein
MHGNVNVNKNFNIFRNSYTFYICLFDVRPPEYIPKKIETYRSISEMYMKVIFLYRSTVCALIFHKISSYFPTATLYALPVWPMPTKCHTPLIM